MPGKRDTTESLQLINFRVTLTDITIANVSMIEYCLILHCAFVVLVYYWLSLSKFQGKNSVLVSMIFVRCEDNR